MNLLLKKMFRDIKKSWTQFIAIFLMAILGVLIYSGLASVGNGMRIEAEKLYKDTNSADIWVYGKDVSVKDVEKVKEIKGVKDVQRRTILKGKLDTDNEAEIELTVLDKLNISKPLLIKGEEFDTDSNGLWISEKFAESKDYKVGDKIKLNILETDMELEIKGWVLSSEHVQHLGNPNEVKPMHDKYTFGFVSSKVIENKFKQVFYNQLVLSLEDNYDENIVKKRIENILEDRFIQALDRKEHISFSGFDDKIEQFDSLATIFPSVFFLLSILTMFTTMTRLIENQRLEIGILSGLGYSKFTIMMHYLSYGLWIGLIGGVIGVILGPLFIPGILFKALKTFYILPNWQAVTLKQNYIVVVIIALCCIFSTYISCVRELKYMPAIILRGKPPKSGKRIFLEEIKGIWNVLSFENKWFIRDLGRNKMRSIMGVVGVFGCMMLILAGIGMKDSVTESVETIYRDQYLYNRKIVFENLDKDLKNKFNDKSEFIEERYGDILSKDEKMSGLISIVEKNELLKLKNTKGENLELKDGDIVITKMIAKNLGIEIGDLIEWRISGDTQNTKSTISHISNSPSPQGIYLTKKTFEDYGYDFEPTSLLVLDKDINKDDILQISGVNDVISKEVQKQDSERMLDSMVTIVYMLILAGVVLGGVILYNLGVLNYTERIREFATLKVLGFYPKEIRSLVIRENIVLTIIGWLVGIPIGLLFLKVYMGIVSSPHMEFVPYVSKSTFIISSVITIICSIGVNYALSFKIDKINMVESLKSIE